MALVTMLGSKDSDVYRKGCSPITWYFGSLCEYAVTFNHNINSVYHGEFSTCLPEGWWGSLEVTVCGPLSGTEAGAPWHQLCCSGGQARLRFAYKLICKCATASSAPFDLLTTLVKWSVLLHLSVENFLVIRGSHWQENMYNYIFGPYLETVLGIYNWSTRSFPYMISLQSMGFFFFFFFYAPSLLFFPEPPLWSRIDLCDKIKW